MKTYVITVSETFPKGNSQEGKRTLFVDKIMMKAKIHTIRNNYELWLKRFREIEAGKACISLRVWTGKPYRSKQREFLRLTKEDGIGIEQLFYHSGVFHIMQGDLPICLISKNDGLLPSELKEWFKMDGMTFATQAAIIHFTPFRYWHANGLQPLIAETEKPKENLYSRIKAVNDKLLSKGLSWEEINTFWDQCISEAKQLKKQEVPDYIKNQLSMDLES